VAELASIFPSCMHFVVRAYRSTFCYAGGVLTEIAVHLRQSMIKLHQGQTRIAPSRWKTQLQESAVGLDLPLLPTSSGPTRTLSDTNTYALHPSRHAPSIFISCQSRTSA
jgi:hypothetical protein